MILGWLLIILSAKSYYLWLNIYLVYKHILKIHFPVVIISVSFTGSRQSRIDSVLFFSLWKKNKTYLEKEWLKINSYHSTWSLFVRSHLVILGSIVSGSFWKTKAGMAASHLCTCMLSHFSHVWIFGIPCTVAHKAPLSMYFSHQEYQTGLPFPLPGHLQGIFLTQGWSPPLLCLLLCRWVPLLLSTGEALTFPSDWLLNIKENLFQGSSFFNSSLYFSEPYKWNVDLY